MYNLQNIPKYNEKLNNEKNPITKRKTLIKNFIKGKEELLSKLCDMT